MTSETTPPHGQKPSDDAEASRRARKNYFLRGAVLVAVCGAVGGGVGIIRTPTYQASVDVSVGANGLGGASVPGYVQSIQTLAANYSRGIKRPDVTDPIAKKTMLSSQTVAHRLEATTIPDSSVIRIDATGSSASSALQLANLGAQELIRVSIGDTTQTVGQLPLDDVEEAELAVLKAERDLSQARRSGESSARALEARARLTAQRTRAETLRLQYGQTRQSIVPVGLAVIRPATEATSDRKQTFVLFIVFGLLLGSVLGFGIRALRSSLAG